MKKAFQLFVLIVFLLILIIGVILYFNPFELRNKIIGIAINHYLSTETLIENEDIVENAKNTIEEKVIPKAQEIISSDKNPLLNEEQEKKLESFGVNIENLPKTISPEMGACFIEKLGQARADEIIAGSAPEALEFIKARECLSK
ncbi:hypothetical protein C0584_02285 [Candidatus Parcubacteria bacterium]|nr:MAG: hypothetical protein C0584_02285 [Candidatus Parcubacteria bacterium]